MKYPALIIDTQKIYHNTHHLVELCERHNISVSAVSKVFCAIPEVAQVMVEAGASHIADSRIENLKKLQHLSVPKILLRIPMLSQVDDVVEYSDISLNSELATIYALSAAAQRIGKVHNIIVMSDLGDLREGVWYEKLMEFMEFVVGLKGINIIGIGTNLTCYGGVIPDDKNLGKLIELSQGIEEKFHLNLEMVSGGNSSSLHLLFKNKMPKGINNLRLGESIVLGLETAFGKQIPGLHRDAFTFSAEIVEIKKKPSVPEGEIGMDAFGEKPTFIDRGDRARAILAVGRQDVNVAGLIPRDPKLIIIGASSDHLIIDLTDSPRRYKIGETIEFDVTYGCLLAASTSPYVHKYLHKENPVTHLVENREIAG